ncbi:MAG TPA: glycosyltransferase [Puia sp.]|nr:glycosyltransferase [Puia sp.]
MSDIKITVLMPAYNTENYIREAIDSVLNQTFRDFELLIINDGSTDQTEHIIRSISDPRIVLVTQPNAGVSAALNTGIGLAKGEFIARFDADDVCYPNRLELQYQFVRDNPDYVLIGSDAVYTDKSGEELFYYSCIGHTNEEIQTSIRQYCPFIHSSVLYRTDIVRELGGYDLRAHTFEDYRLWIKFIGKGKVCNFNSPLIYVRLNPESITVDEKLRGKRFESLKKEMAFAKQSISENQENELLEILKSQNFSTFKHYSYYILIAKKYLWNNTDAKKVRKNLKMALRFKPVNTTIIKLFLFSLLPQKLILFVYRLSKRNLHNA